MSSGACIPTACSCFLAQVFPTFGWLKFFVLKMSFADRVVGHLGRHSRMTSTGIVVVPLHCLTSLPSVLALKSKLNTKKFSAGIAQYEERQGEYNMMAVMLGLTMLGVKTDEWAEITNRTRRALRTQSEQLTQTAQPIPITDGDSQLHRGSSSSQLTEENTDEKSHSYDGLSYEQVVKLLHQRDARIQSLKKSCKKAANLKLKRKSCKKTVKRPPPECQLVVPTKESNDSLAITKHRQPETSTVKRPKLTKAGTFALAIRRNCPTLLRVTYNMSCYKKYQGRRLSELRSKQPLPFKAQLGHIGKKRSVSPTHPARDFLSQQHRSRVTPQGQEHGKKGSSAHARWNPCALTAALEMSGTSRVWLILSQ